MKMTGESEKYDWGAWDEKNLETLGVVQKEGEPWVTVADNHPVMNIVRLDILNLQKDNSWIAYEPFHKITPGLFTRCCDTIRLSMSD